MCTCAYLSVMIRCYNQLCCKCLHLSLIIKSAVHVDIFMLISALMFLCTGLLYMCIDAIIGNAVNVYILVLSSAVLYLCTSYRYNQVWCTCVYPRAILSYAVHRHILSWGLYSIILYIYVFILLLLSALLSIGILYLSAIYMSAFHDFVLAVISIRLYMCTS